MFPSHTYQPVAIVLNSTDEIIQWAFTCDQFNHYHAFQLVESLVKSLKRDQGTTCEAEDYQYLATSFISIHFDPFINQDPAEELQLFHDIIYFLGTILDSIIKPILNNENINGIETQIYQGGNQMMIASF